MNRVCWQKLFKSSSLFCFYFILFYFIKRAQKTKPGKVVHLSDCPTDSSKILLGYESGLICLWNIKLKRADLRFNGTAEVNLPLKFFYATGL